MADFWPKMDIFQSKSEYFLHKYGHNLTFINGMCLKFGRNVQNGLENKNMPEKFRLKIHNGGFLAKNGHFSLKIDNFKQK